LARQQQPFHGLDRAVHRVGRRGLVRNAGPTIARGRRIARNRA
jgi:hypothetical protein